MVAVIGILLQIASPSQAQVELGIVGGINIANLKGTISEGEGAGLELDPESRTVMGFGGIVSVPISNTFGILLEPTYLEKGAQEKEEDFALTWKAQYLEIPVLLKAALGSRNIRPYLIAGPSLAFKLGSNLKVGGGGLALNFDVDDVLTGTDFSLVFGGGVSILMRTVTVFADFRYALGVSDIFQGGTLNVLGFDLVIPDADVKTRGILVMGGLAFPLRSR